MRSFLISLTLFTLMMNFYAICKSQNYSKRQDPAPPKPFFPFHARKHFTDYYNGNHAEPENLLKNSEFVVVMYYAPWSRRCIQTRLIFANIARSFSRSSDISFAAVNCFHRYGGCRKSYKTHTYPVIVAYVGKQSLMYTGLLASDYIYRWISRLRNPVRRLVSANDLENFIEEYDVAVISSFDSEDVFIVSYKFQQYIKAALIVLQRDESLDKVGFAVLTNKSLAKTLNSWPTPWIQLRTWNSTFMYDVVNNNATQISDWIKNHTSGAGLQWISSETNGYAKSEELLSVLQDGPSVIVFMDRQVLYPHNWAVTVIEQTIMEYFTCDAGIIDKVKIRANKRAEMAYERDRLLTLNNYQCQKITAYAKEIRKCCKTQKVSLMSQCFQCRAPNKRENSSKGSCKQRSVFSYNTYSSLFHSVPCLSALSLQNEACQIRAVMTNAASTGGQIFGVVEEIEQLFRDCCTLLFSKEKQLNMVRETFEECAKYRLARDLYHQLSRSVPSKFYPFDDESITGLSCNKNNSLRFIGIDVRYSDYILKQLGQTYSGNAVALIVDPHTERTSIMEAKFSRCAFRNFLRAFHNGSLVPHKASQLSQKEPETANLNRSNLSIISSTNAKSFEEDILSMLSF